MAAPPIFQMLWGRPDLDVYTDEFAGTDGKVLLVAIKNKLLRNKFLLSIGVEREIGNVQVFFDIQEQGTGKFIAKDVPSWTINTATRERGVTAQAHPAFTIGAWMINHKDTSAVIIDGGTARRSGSPLKTIDEGNYTAQVTVIRASEVYKLRKDFKIGKQEWGTFWIG
jgi:hypothetical protein